MKKLSPIEQREGTPDSEPADRKVAAAADHAYGIENKLRVDASLVAKSGQWSYPAIILSTTARLKKEKGATIELEEVEVGFSWIRSNFSEACLVDEVLMIRNTMRVVRTRCRSIHYFCSAYQRGVSKSM